MTDHGRYRGFVQSETCFVQFIHPGGEHLPDAGRFKDWIPWHRPHARKFMQLRGSWVERNGSERSGDLYAWGEWEAQSELLRTLGRSRTDGYPQHLWRAYYRVPADGRFDGLRNTDPFIFGGRFLYSNCQQPSKPGLRSLGRGSVIAFGSYKARQWILDTVLVVAGSVPYTASQADRELEDLGLDVEVPEAFLDVTAAPLASEGWDGELRLYWGATPDDPVDGMYSFFAASPADGGPGFARPAIQLDSDYFTKKLSRNHKRTPASLETLDNLWQSLVEQVHDGGLVLGVHAAPPPCEGTAPPTASGYRSAMADALRAQSTNSRRPPGCSPTTNPPPQPRPRCA